MAGTAPGPTAMSARFFEIAKALDELDDNIADRTAQLFTNAGPYEELVDSFTDIESACDHPNDIATELPLIPNERLRLFRDTYEATVRKEGAPGTWAEGTVFGSVGFELNYGSRAELMYEVAGLELKRRDASGGVATPGQQTGADAAEEIPEAELEAMIPGYRDLPPEAQKFMREAYAIQKRATGTQGTGGQRPTGGSTGAGSGPYPTFTEPAGSQGSGQTINPNAWGGGSGAGASGLGATADAVRALRAGERALDEMKIMLRCGTRKEVVTKIFALKSLLNMDPAILAELGGAEY